MKYESTFHEILKHFKNYFGANLANKLLGLISAPVLTRLLTPNDYGILSVLLSYVNILIIVACLDMSSSISIFYYHNRDQFKEYVSNALMLCIIPFSIFSIIVLFLPGFTNSLINLDIKLIPFILILVLAGIINNIYRNINIPLKKSKEIAKISVFSVYTIFGLTVLLVLMMDQNRYLGAVYARSIVALIIIVFLFHFILKFQKFTIKKEHIKHIVSFCLPYLPYSLSGIIFTTVDRIMIERYIGAGETGLYSVAFTLTIIITSISGALLTSWTPYYLEDYSSKDYERIDLNTKRIFAIIIVVTALFMFIGPEIGMILFAQSFHLGLKLVPILSFGILFTFIWQMVARPIGFYNQTIYISLISIIAGSVNVILNYLFIPMYGYEAAAVTSAFSYILMAFMGWVVTKFIVKGYLSPINIFLLPIMVLMLLYGLFEILEIAKMLSSFWLKLITKTILLALFTYFIYQYYLKSMVKSES